MNSPLFRRLASIPSSWLKIARRRGGSALLVVLSFVLLLSIVTAAFLSRALLEKKVSDSSANQTRTDLFAAGAVNSIISDFQAEIAAGSQTNPLAGATVKTSLFIPEYITKPAAVQTITPSRTWSTTGDPNDLGPNGTYSNGPSNPFPNLLKRSLTGASTSAGKGYFFYPYSDTTDYPNETLYPPTEKTFTTQDPNDSTSIPSLNGRYYTAQRWNQPLLLPKANTSKTDITPNANFTVPDWILVQRDGTNPTAWSKTLLAAAPGVVTPSATSNPVVGRYAYTVYDEGGLLDMNVAGFPFSSNSAKAITSANPYQTAPTYVGYKYSLANADLRMLQIPSTASPAGYVPSNTQLLSNKAINSLVGWRNYATLGATGNILSGYTFNTTNAAFPALNFNNYFLNLQANTSGFLQTANAGLSSGQSDRKFSSRQQLIDLLLNDIAQGNSTSIANYQNALQFMGTFSRDLNTPSYQPDTGRPRMNPKATAADPAAQGANLAYADDNSANTTPDGLGNGYVNPSFVTTLVQTSFTRNDGTTANVGDPLVKRRFALNRLAWLTYKGPSANRNIANPSSASDNDIYVLENNYGISQAFLAQGTATNIQAYFGLTWKQDPTDSVYKWWYGDKTQPYNVHTTTASNGTATVTKITELGGGSWGMFSNLNPHDPDFFELLKAAILAGSKGKTITYLSADAGANQLPGFNTNGPLNPWDYQNLLDSSLDNQILQIGANIIAQYQPSNYAPEIVFSTGLMNATDPYDVRGVENMPYIYRVRTGTLGLRAPNKVVNNDSTAYSTTPTNAGYFTDTGVGALMFIPEIWNPHDVDADYQATASVPYPIPAPTQFRIVADSAPPYLLAQTGTNSWYQGFYGTGEGPSSSNISYSYTVKPYFSYNRNDPTGSGGVITGLSPGFGTASVHDLQYLNAANTQLTFTIPATTTGQAFFREPTVLARPNVPAGSNLSIGWTIGSGSSSYPTPIAYDLGKIQNSTNPTCWGTLPPPSNAIGLIADGNTNPLNLPSAVISQIAAIPTQNLYVGIVCGLYPLQFTDGTTIYRADISGPNGLTNTTLRMQYLDPNTANNWVTYDTKYFYPGAIDMGANPPVMMDSGSPVGAPFKSAQQRGAVETFDDPRTSRFGHPNSDTNGLSGSFQLPCFLFSDINNNDYMLPDRPDTDIGYGYKDAFANNIAPGWVAGNFSNPFGSVFANFDNFLWGPYEQNIATYDVTNTNRFNGDGSTDGNQAYPQVPCYADPDGVVRRASGGYAPVLNSKMTSSGAGSSITGLPMAVATQAASTANPTYPLTGQPNVLQNQNWSRPYILHRPFRSVAELGYVFSGTPWKNLDFVNPESGDSALLDVFCINDTDNPNGLVAGKVNLNTAQPPVLWAILAGAYKDEYEQTQNNVNNVNNGNGNRVIGYNISTSSNSSNVTEASDLAHQLIAQRTGWSQTAPQAPITNLRDLVGKWVYSKAATPVSGTTVPYYDGQPNANSITGTYFDGFSNNLSIYDPGNNNGNSISPDEDQYTAYIQRFRESAIRALTSVGQTRVWNVMIDVVAQTGRFPSTAQNSSNFLVEGERRYWVHVAIDRYTGQVLDQQVEEVKQ
jgi:hypothetical protein